MLCNLIMVALDHFKLTLLYMIIKNIKHNFSKFSVIFTKHNYFKIISNTLCFFALPKSCVISKYSMHTHFSKLFTDFICYIDVSKYYIFVQYFRKCCAVNQFGIIQCLAKESFIILHISPFKVCIVHEHCNFLACKNIIHPS